MSDLFFLSTRTQSVYERNAHRFDAERPKVLIERSWLLRFLKELPAEAAILDLGCGTGDPIARFLMEEGCRVTGIDASHAMIALAREKWPAGDWRIADMRDLDLPDRFDGIIGWDSFFHLTGDEQRAVLPVLAGHLKPGGALMLTVGHEEGEVEGQVGDDRVYHASLSETEYRELLEAHGLSVLNFVPEDPACDFHTVLLARKAGEQVA